MRVHVDVVQFHIANPALAALIGADTSTINTEVSLFDMKTGALIGDKFEVHGATENYGIGILGAAFIRTPKKELDEATDSLANNMKIAIFGE